jgi:hypothetical protein
MIRRISAWALWLDTWLQERLGRPYNAILGVGLVIEIVRHIVLMAEHVRSADNLLHQVLPLLLETALLIHQVGALSHRFEARDRLKARRG